MKNQYAYLVSIGYHKLAFKDKDSAMELYRLLSDSVPVTSFYFGTLEVTVPEHLKNIDLVRESDVEIELKRVDASRISDLTKEEFKEKCKPVPTEIDGEVSLVDEVDVRLIGSDVAEPDDVDMPF